MTRAPYELRRIRQELLLPAIALGVLLAGAWYGLSRYSEQLLSGRWLPAEAGQMQAAAAPALAVAGLPATPAAGPAVARDLVAAAYRRFGDIRESGGLAGAERFSRYCHQQAATTHSWDDRDYCAAFDQAGYRFEAAREADAGPQAYFKAMYATQARFYAPLTPEQATVEARLAAVRNSLDKVHDAVVDEPLDRFRASMLRYVLPARPDGRPSGIVAF